MSKRFLAKTLAVVAICTTSGMGDDWPGWMGPNRDGYWNETGIVNTLSADKMKPTWTIDCAAGYAGPAVADGQVYLFDYVSDDPIINNAGAQMERKGKERLRAIDAKTGKVTWSQEYDRPYKISYPSGPRATPTVADGHVYTLGAEGDLMCRNAKTGELVWQHQLQKEYSAPKPMWGFSGSPLVVNNRLYCGVGGDGSLLVCFDAKTGKEVWKAGLSKDAGYSPPVLAEFHGKKQIVFWDPMNLAGYDPETGRQQWAIECKPQYEMSITRPIISGDVVFAGGIGWFGAAAKVAEDLTAKELYRPNKDSAIYPVNSSVVVVDGVGFGMDTRGPYRAFDVATGKRLWDSNKLTGARPVNSATAFTVKNGEQFFIMNETGELVLAKMSKEGFEEVAKVKILEPTSECFGRNVVWSHPAFANKSIYARNDKQLVCISLAQ